MVFKLAEEKMVEWSSKEKPEGSCTNNMSVNGERDVTYAHWKVFCTSKGARGAAVRAFHGEGTLCVDPRADFLCEVFSNDDNL